ncbi:MAG: hypothetical protein ABIJ52_05275 [Pseudomonadota bacterium]
MIHLIKSIRKPRVIESSRRRRWLIACPTSGRQATILSILLILSKKLRVLCAFAVQSFQPETMNQKPISVQQENERPHD